MNIKKQIIVTVTCICLSIIIYSMFLPFHEGWVCASCEDNDFGRIDLYEAPEVGLVAVYNGFGSAFALFNLLLVVVIAVGIFFSIRVLAIPIVVLVGFLAALGLVQLGNSAGFGGPICDRMLVGYDITTICSWILITLSFYNSFTKPGNKKDDLLLDEEL